MPYIIDGHNLIGKLPGISLEDVDDETRLVEWLGEFSRRSRKQVEVYFDMAPPGYPRARNFGSVIAYYIRQGDTADQAIARKLARLKGAARNWTVVSSDHEVQAAAQAARARLLSAESFTQLLLGTLTETTREAPEDAALSSEEVEDWLRLFGGEAEGEG